MLRMPARLLTVLFAAGAMSACNSVTGTDAFVPNDWTVAGRDLLAPVQTDALRYFWTQNGFFWQTSIPIVFTNIYPDTLYICCNGGYPVELQKRVNGAWVPFGGRGVLDVGGRSIAVPPRGTFKDTIVIANAEPGHNAAPEFASADIEAVFRLVPGRIYWRLVSGQPVPADTVAVRYRYSNPFVVVKGS